jgi:transcriptional regulator with XRE-family HTH domain
MTFAARVGLNIARERRRAGISQEELGVRASLHRTEISQLERGIRIPRCYTIVKLAGSLGIGAGALLDGLAWTPGWTRDGEFTAVGEASGSV